MRTLAFLGIFTLVASARAVEYRLCTDGSVNLGDGLVLRTEAFAKGWKGPSLKTCGWVVPNAKSGIVPWQFKIGSTRYGRGTTTLLPLADGRIYCRIGIDMELDFPTEGLVCTFAMPTDKVVGGTIEDDQGRKAVFPKTYAKLFPYSGHVERMSMTLPGFARTLTFEGDKTSMCVQDDRKWGRSFSFRRYMKSKTLKSGEHYEMSFFLSGEQATVAYAQATVVTQNDEWLPLDDRRDIAAGSALDFTQIVPNEGPAGQYGWLRAVNGHFAFEKKPNEPQRFWGANFCGEGNCPSHAASERVVRRFRQHGYNTLRFHHYERALTKKSPDRMTFNAESMDNFDYFFAKAKEAGIYMTTDLFVSRSIAWRDVGIDREGLIDMSLMKGMFLVHEPSFENWKRFARQLMLHRNPYTGLTYAEDPAMPFIALVNEGIFAWLRGIFDQDVTRAKWREWLAEKRRVDPKFAPKGPEDCMGYKVDEKDAAKRAVLKEFMSDMEARFAVRARDYLRSIGVKALLTDWNCGSYVREDAITNTLDYVDMHFYVSHPVFVETRWGLPTYMMNARPDCAKGCLPVDYWKIARAAHMPFTVSEWNFTAPNACRGAAGLLTGATAARLDWDVMWRFSYMGDEKALDDAATTLSYFDIASDPFQVASDRAGVLLYRRRELPVDATQSKVPLQIEKGTGRFTVRSAQTVGGFGKAGDAVAAGSFTARLAGCEAAIWVSSLDGKPVESSSRILLSHLTDLKSEGITFQSPDCRVLMKWGARQCLVRRGAAEIALALQNPAAYDVWSLATDGTRLEKQPTRIENDKLRFTADVRGADGKAHFLYEIVQKSN